MKTRSKWRVCITLALAAVVASCGGSDEASGGATPFSISPSTMTITGSAGTCYSGFAVRVFVHGGTGPYRVENTLPDALVLSTTSVPKSGDSFDVFVTGVCLSPGTINVVDQTGRLVTLTVNNNRGT